MKRLFYWESSHAYLENDGEKVFGPHRLNGGNYGRSTNRQDICRKNQKSV